MQYNNAAPQAPGKGLLKVTGILMVIFSSLALILMLISMLALGALGSFFAGSGIAAASTVLILFAFLPTIFEFVTGILGIANANKPEKAGICLAFGILVIVLTVVSIISNGFEWTSLTGLVLPVLYLIGAVQNKQAA